MADLWATACWRARHAPWLSQTVAVAIQAVAVELVAGLPPQLRLHLAAVAVYFPPFLIRGKCEARVREKIKCRDRYRDRVEGRDRDRDRDRARDSHRDRYRYLERYRGRDRDRN